MSPSKVQRKVARLVKALSSPAEFRSAARRLLKLPAPSAPPAPKPGVVILADPLSPTAGHTIPVRALWQVATAVAASNSLPPVRLVEVPKVGPAAVSGDLLIINSISPLLRKQVRNAITRCVETQRLRVENIFVYLHEERFVFERLKGEGAGDVVESLADYTILPLTHALKRQYEARGWTCTEPVYNSPSHRPGSKAKIAGNPDFVNVLTIASFQTRKGVDRVLALAEAAIAAGEHQVHFHWIGPHAAKVSGPLPENLPSNFTWWGALSPEHLQHLVPAFSCVLLPSYSDPLPLSIWEAMLQGKLCFVSDAVGNAEIAPSELLRVLDFEKDAATLLSEILTSSRSAKSDLAAPTKDLLEYIEPVHFYARVAKAIGRPSVMPLPPA